MKKIINYLYNKYCTQPIKKLYIGGIQREFTTEISPTMEKQIVEQCKIMVDSVAFPHVINEELKKHINIFFSFGSSEALREHSILAINLILSIEGAFNYWASQIPDAKKEFDKYKVL